MRFDLWAAISCGQNLDVKELRGRNLDDEGPKRDDAISAHRHCLDDDRASLMRGARSDVTRNCGKLSLEAGCCGRMRVKGPAQAKLGQGTLESKGVG